MPARLSLIALVLALLVLGVSTSPAGAAAQRHTATSHPARSHASKAGKKHRGKRRKAHRVADAAPAPAVDVAAPAPVPPTGCANTALIPDASNLGAVRDALVCLHNQVRGAAGAPGLGENPALEAAGSGHSDEMVRLSYFDHVAPDGGTFDQRILAAGYTTGAQQWTLGENLAWGEGDRSTPAALMDAWMASPAHRENILNGDYREFGIGLRLGTPSGGAGGVTVSVEFGARA